MKTTKQDKELVKLLRNVLTVLVILLLALISFVGIYVKDKNSMRNIIPEYKLGMDLKGSRNIVIKVDDSTKTKQSSGVTISDGENSNVEDTTEEPVNAPETLTEENYEKVRKIINQRLDYMNVSGYIMKYDNDTGRINIELPENSDTDYIAQYCITKGDFRISDSDTNVVLLSNEHLKDAKVQSYATENGTTVYLDIEFNKEGKDKLYEISKTYVSSKDEEGKDTTRKVKMTLDDETIIETYFQEEMTDGHIQLSMGTTNSSADLQRYVQQGSNLAVFLNTDPMPVTYAMETNRFVHSDITNNAVYILLIIIALIEALMAVYMIFKYKRNGLIAAYINIGFLAILLLALRYTNVILSLTGLFEILMFAIIEYIITTLITKEYSKGCDNEVTSKNTKKLMKNISLSLLPIAIMGVTFSLISYESIASAGMVIFWSTLIMVLYNIIILSIGIFDTTKTKKPNKKSTNKEPKKSKTKKK